METRKENKVLQALGLCARARKLIFGTPMICEALKSKDRPRMVLCASDNSENTAKRLHDRCAFYEVPLTVLEVDGETLARAVGKSGALAAVAVSDENFCRLIGGSINENTIT